ncbi:MAG: aspartate 1-decarboxylase [bacterium]
MAKIFSREILKSKIYYAKVTGADLHYEGSMGIDENIMEKANILPGEVVHVLNVENGSRIITYAIPEKRGSRAFLLYGPAVRSGLVGDRVVILSYCSVLEEDAATFTPDVVKLDKDNNIE